MAGAASSAGAGVLALPDDVDSQLSEFQRLLEAVKASLTTVTASVRSPQEVQALPPLQRGQLFLSLASAVHALQQLHQRCAAGGRCRMLRRMLEARSAAPPAAPPTGRAGGFGPQRRCLGPGRE